MAMNINIRTLNAPVSRRDHSRGPVGAAVTLVEYGDYQCPAAGGAYPIVKQLQRELGSRLRFVFRNFPQRDIHPHAQRAAEAAEAASVQGRFWEMHDILFEHQHALTDRHLRSYAAALGLDSLRFDCELVACVHGKRVREHVLAGVGSGVTSTPTFFINGVCYEGAWDLPALMHALEPAIAA